MSMYLNNEIYINIKQYIYKYKYNILYISNNILND